MYCINKISVSLHGKLLRFCSITFVLNYLSVLPSFSLVVMAFLIFGQVAFKTGDHKQQVIFIGGLTDGFLATEYVL